VEFKIYPTDEPKEANWVLEWRIDSMRASNFEYYESKEEAETAMEQMKNRQEAFKSGHKLGYDAGYKKGLGDSKELIVRALEIIDRKIGNGNS